MTAAAQKHKKVLVVDVGGMHIKVRVTGQREEREIPSGAAMTAHAPNKAVARDNLNLQFIFIQTFLWLQG